MTRRFVIILTLFLIGAQSVRAQQKEKQITVDDLLSDAEDWAKENLDDDVLNLLAEVDRDRVRAFLLDFESRLQTNSVYELAPLRSTAREFVPYFEQWEETLPLAQWLKTRLDYFDISDALKSKAEKLAPPTLPEERAAWKRQFESRPIPSKAEMYVPRLKRIFTAEKTPPQLVWVAEVESSFNPAARSPVGAAGLFQLMKPTARSYGLSTFFPDERTDPDKNAQVAAKYLRHLHDRFGDWPLALAAYNAGETRVDSLLKNSRSRDYTSIASKLPAETQLYVPKCEAVIQKREGLALAALTVPAK